MVYQTLNDITISSSALVKNYLYFHSLHPDTAVCPVLKGNAYGHGLTEVARIVDRQIRPPYILVDSLYEAYELYRQKIHTPILIMGYTDPANYAIWKKLPFTFTVYDIDSLLALEKHQPGARIHLKLDTGMCRLGITPAEIPHFIAVLKTCRHLRLEGIYSHLSQADDPKKITFTHNQIRLFKSMVAQFAAAGFTFKYKHIAATAGASIINDPYFNLVRLGLGFYGYSPFGPHTDLGRQQRQQLQPALTFTSRIALIKAVHPGDQIGYGGSYHVKQDETIAILTAGYHDGLPLGLSNRASLLFVNGIHCPIVGRISMDMTTVKIPRTVEAKIGDKITVISPQIDDPCSVYKLASLLNTIPYTILTALHPSTRRTIL
jgi:alanine racemase